MSNSEKLVKKKWAVKMTILDSNDHEFSDISKIPSRNNGSARSSTAAFKKSKNNEKKHLIGQKSLDMRKKKDSVEPNIESKRKVARKTLHTRAVHDKAEKASAHHELRSSKVNSASTGSKNSVANERKASIQGKVDMCNETSIGTKRGKKPNKLQKPATIISAHSHSSKDKSPSKSQIESTVTETMLALDPPSSDSGPLPERSSKTTNACEPSMPDLFDDRIPNPISSVRNTSKFKNISGKIKRRRLTTGCLSSNKLTQVFTNDNDKVSTSKGDHKDDSGKKSTTPSNGQNNTMSELLKELAQQRKIFFDRSNLH